MQYLALIAVVLALVGWTIFDALRQGRRLEAAGWFAFGAALAGVFILARADGPGWAANLLIALAFLLAAPLMWINLRRKWRGTRL